MQSEITLASCSNIILLKVSVLNSFFLEKYVRILLQIPLVQNQLKLSLEIEAFFS